MLIGLACPHTFQLGLSKATGGCCWEIWDPPGLAVNSCLAGAQLEHLLRTLEYSPPCVGMTRGWGGIPAAPSAHRWHSRQSARGSEEKASERSQYLDDTDQGYCPSCKLMLNCTNHSRERKTAKSDVGQTRTLEIMALQGTVSDCQGEGLRGGWLLLPQASCGLKGVGVLPYQSLQGVKLGTLQV